MDIDFVFVIFFNLKEQIHHWECDQFFGERNETDIDRTLYSIFGGLFST